MSSWFSNRFTASFKAPDSHPGDEEQDDERTSHGQGVKEDLSELTKSFTRQIWGVASFLAPPPTTKSELEELDPSRPSSSDHHTYPHITSLVHPGEISLSSELVDVDFRESIDPVEPLQEQKPLDLYQRSAQVQNPLGDESLSPHSTPDHGLTGIGKDLAELKGSVTIGFSKILKAVREEIDRIEHDKQQRAYNDDEEEEDNDKNTDERSFVHTGRLPVLNSLLKPLLSGILHKDGDEMLKESGTVDDLAVEEIEDFEDDDPSDERGHQKSRPTRGPSLQRTWGESLIGVSKLASNLFPMNLDSDDEQIATATSPNFDAVGVTEEVLTFARNISMHPETWLDFPLFTDDDEDDDFEMSDAQKEHVYEVEHASPRLAALRIELCPDYMSEGRFWKIYFVLLHSRLSKKDAVLLSTPQIMEARALLTSNLQKNEFPGNRPQGNGPCELDKKDSSRSAQSFKIVSLQSAMEVPARDFDRLENAGAGLGSPLMLGDALGDASEEVQNKNVLASTVKLATLHHDEEEADRWLQEESLPHEGLAATGLGNEEDVSFSDLEEDEDSLMSKVVGSSNMKGGQGWVQLDTEKEEQESKLHNGKHLDKQKIELASRRGSNDWLTMEDEDSDFA